ncbi:hypothetical protein OF122_13185 [Pelagibacterium flavum]|uniref:Uncharacterized protein n=1 Tax=Pelagibacterium flavum TaxID=2984530 RepID=A0ABY6IK93_9HYPH|nr:hypothetical protein [Pelagibacterium sp. YIM 151497]UYQ71013.1 hypothetical protein OF122_13185 [Pelagibacterium sp. YIM 151497]
MPTRTVKNADELELLKVYLDGRKLPFTVQIEDGRNRSNEQNRLSHKWYAEIADQTGEHVEDVRARCKLEIGVPILRQSNEKFRATYDKSIRPLPYEAKLEAIRDMDIPVTRLMKVPEMTKYMELVFQRHAEFGIELTIPPDRYAFDPERKAA